MTMTPAPGSGGPMPTPKPEAQAPAPQGTEAPAAPAPAPAAQPAPAPAPAPEPSPAPAPVPVPAFATGNDTFDSVGKVLAKAGVDNANAVLAELATKGSISLETKAEMLAKGDPAIVELAIRQAEGELARLKGERVSEVNELKTYANGLFKGEDAELTWTQMQAFANSQAFTPEEQATLNKLMQSKDTGKFAINEIAARYRNSAGFSQSADLIQGDQGTAPSFTPLSKQDYVSEVRVAVQKYGEHSREVKSLRARREASMKRGYK